MGNNKLRKALKAFFIISLICLVAYAGLIFGFNFIAASNDFNNLITIYKAETSMMIGEFIYPFAPGSNTAAFQDFYNAVGVNPIIISIVALVLASLIVLTLIIGLIRVISKHKGGYAFYALAWLTMLYIIAIGLACESTLLFAVTQDLFMGKVTEYLPAIIGFAAFVFSILAVITTIITYILGMKYAGVKKVAEDAAASESNADQPVLAEENLAPEEAQDVVAENNPEYVAVIEPEPAPETSEEEPADDIVPEEPACDNEPEEIKEEPEPVQYVEPEPIPEPQPDETNNHVEVNVNNQAPQAAAGIDPNSLASLLREVVRDIVRDEIARNNANQPRVNEDNNRNGGNQTITGATFGGPLVVQYFNGGINGVTPPQPPVEAAPVKEEPKPAPAPVEEKKEEPAPAPAKEPEPVKEEPKPAPAPAPVVVAPVETPAQEEKQVYERLSFAERLLQSDQEILDLYNELKNEILSYGVKSRVSAVGDTFRLHKKMYVRITVAGKSLKLYFALNPDDYKDSKIPVQDAGHKDLYAEIPLVFKVRSGLSVRRCKELIQDTMEKDGLEQGEIGKVNWAKELKAELKEKAKGNKDED